MLKQEYLNPDVMFRVLNQLCKEKGYVLNGFKFGILHFPYGKKPDIFQNRHDYNIVYRLDVVKLVDDYKTIIKNYVPTYQTNVPNTISLTTILTKFFENKTFYFDVFAEALLMQNNQNCIFSAFPSFFFFNEKTYYAIHNDVKSLPAQRTYGKKYARDVLMCSNTKNLLPVLKEYFYRMNIAGNALYSISEILKNSQSLFKGYRILDNSTKCPIDITTLQNLKQCLEIWNNSISPETLKSDTWNNWLDHVLKIRKILSIHKQNVPLFYTDNCIALLEQSGHNIHDFIPRFELEKAYSPEKILTDLKSVLRFD